MLGTHNMYLDDLNLDFMTSLHVVLLYRHKYLNEYI